MKKMFLLCALGIATVALHAQEEGRVGINTTDPKASLEVRKNTNVPSTQPQGVLFPNFTSAERSAFTNPEIGTMIFNTDKKCLEMYFGVKGGVPQWSCIPDANNKQNQNVSVEPAGWSGQFVGGVALSGQTVKFKLVNNGFGAITNVNFSDAVDIQNLSSDASKQGDVSVKGGQHTGITLNGGESKVLTYQLEGTPQAGTLVANFNKLGLQADQQTQVGLGSAKAEEKTEYVVSLTYNGTDIQGKINNTTDKLVVKIPYTNGKGSYNAVTATASTAEGQGGDINNLSLNIPAGNFGVTGELTATITVGGSDQEYLVKKLAPGKDYVIATIPYELNGQTYQVVVKGIGGIPDKKFGVQTNGKLEHQFIYVPIKGSDGKLWLNNNLGADYANINSPAFNPLQQATSLTDKNAYGSHFQFGRDADGHELITYPTATTGNRVHPRIPLYDSSQLQTYTNPCPDGYHVPTKMEWDSYNNLLSSKNASGWFADPLKLTYAGDLNSSGRWNPAPGTSGAWFWSSSPDSNSLAWYLIFSVSVSYTYNQLYSRNWGRPLRCRQD